MSFDLSGRWAVVSGASSGIGAELARELAKRQCHLILVARRAERLRELAVQLESEFHVETQIHALDLSVVGAAQALFELVKDQPISVLVNNAGFGSAGPFPQMTSEQVANMIMLNNSFLAQFTLLLWPRLLAADAARVLNVGSIAGEQGVPNMAVYAATKAFVNHFSQGLSFELKADSKLRVTCLMPGKTESEFFDVASMRGSRFVKSNVMSAKAVARQAVHAMVLGKPRVITGWTNWMSVMAGRYSPQWLLRSTMRRLFGDL